MDHKYIIALEFSGSQVKGALAKVSNSQAPHLSIPEVEAIIHEDKASCVQYGRVQNILDATKDATFVLQRLENDPKMMRGRITCAYVGLSGRSLASERTAAELVLPSEQLITDDILRRLFVEATKPVAGEKKVVKVLPRKYTVDNQPSLNPVGAMGTRIKGEFTVVTCNPANRRNLELVLNEKLRLPVKEYVTTPLAIADMVLGEEEKQLGCVLVDVGAQTTTVVIYKDRALEYLATLPLGSHNITRDIATGRSLTIERAEIAKQSQGNALPDNASQANDESARINCYVQARAGEIIANIIAQIGFAGFKPADLPAGFVITGRGSKLANFAQALEAQSKMKVRRASIPATVSVTDRSVDPSDYASLIAIAMRGAAVCDEAGCVSLPQPAEEEKPQPAAIGFDSRISDDDDDDDDWAADTDRKAKAKAQPAARKEKEKEKGKKDKDQPEEQAAARKSRTSVLDVIRTTVGKIFLEPDEDDDDDIDLDLDAE